MDVIERLTLEAAQADTMLASEHRHRYAFAAAHSTGLRVLDLCCGSGYGSAILASSASSVLGVDNDVATIDTARATVAAEHPNVSFSAADAVAFLTEAAADRFDLVVCFEGLEHLEDLGAALAALARLAAGGTRLLLSLPNDKLTGVENPFHVTMFGYDEALAVLEQLPAAIMIPQVLAEGSLLCPPGAEAIAVEVELGDRREPEYANHFLICVGFSAEELNAAVHGRMHLSASPIFNRWSEGLKRGIWGLRRENARLARRVLGRGGSAAAAAVARQAELEERVRGLAHRARVAEQRVAELELGAGGAAAAEALSTGLAPDAALGTRHEAVPALGIQLEPGEDINSWDSRRRRAAEFLIPWIEQTVPLAGKTVLEYGCGHGAVSCAVAARAERHIGLDIDAAAIAEGRERLAAAGVANATLEHHELDAILAAVAAHRGEVDVFLLYAVLEHMTTAERLAILRLAREVVKPDGAIVVCETPNRLISFDHHTARMPYLHMLDADLALEYYRHSERREFTDAIDAACAQGREQGLEALTRWGRGVSFHEFEVVFGDLSRHVIGSSYDPLLFGERPVHADDVSLARYLGRLRPDLAPCWSRYWLDVILAPQPVERRPPLLRPWVADTSASGGVGWSDWETLHFVRPGAVLRVELPQPTDRIVLGSVSLTGEIATLTVRPEGNDPAVFQHRAGAPVQAYSVLDLAAVTSRFSVEASADCHLVFVGYQA